MRQQKSEVVSNHFFPIVDPNFLPKDAEASGTPEIRFVIGILAKAGPLAHRTILLQMMRLEQHLLSNSSDDGRRTETCERRKISVSNGAIGGLSS